MGKGRTSYEGCVCVFCEDVFHLFVWEDQLSFLLLWEFIILLEGAATFKYLFSQWKRGFGSQRSFLHWESGECK